jgi:hypothetical protein
MQQMSKEHSCRPCANDRHLYPAPHRSSPTGVTRPFTVYVARPKYHLTMDGQREKLDDLVDDE